MMKTSIFNWLLILLVLLPASIYSRSSWVNHINRQRISGLLIEGQYVWMATSNTGLVRYNTTTKDQQFFDLDNGFFSDRDFHLALDSSGSVWAASGDKIAPFKNGKWEQPVSFTGRINDLTVDFAGNLWVAISDGIFKHSGDSFERVAAFDGLREADKYVNDIVSGGADSCVYVRVEKSVFCFGIDGQYRKKIDIPLDNPWGMAVSKGKLFVTSIGTVGILNNENWSYFSTEDGTLSNAVLYFSVSDQGDIWAFGQDLMVFENETWVVKYRYEAGDIRINSVAPINGNVAWVAGAYFFGKLIWGELQQIQTNSPANNLIRYIYADQDGTIWAQCRDGKNVLSRFAGNQWTYPFSKNTTGMLRTADSVYYFIQKDNVHVYGQVINGVKVNNLIGHGFIPPGEINAIAQDHKGDIWFATSQGVIRNFCDTLFSSNNCGFASNHITTILSSSDSSLWIGGNNGTLAFLKNGNWTSCNLNCQHNINALAKDSSGGVWIGTDSSFFNITDLSGELIAREVAAKLDHVSSIVIDFNTRIWVGTNDGLYCYENEKWTVWRRSEGITSNVVTSLAINTDSVLWVGTYDRGISTMDLRSVSVRTRILKNNPAEQFPKRFIYLGNMKHSLENQRIYLLNGRRAGRISSFRKLPSNQYIITPDEKTKKHNKSR